MVIKIKEGEEKLVGVIGDEDTVTGMLLAGVGDNNAEKKARYGPNYFIATRDKHLDQLEEAFTRMTNRPDIVVVLITQGVANDIRHLIVDYDKTIPAVLEIPSKDIPYDANDDTVLCKVNIALGNGDVVRGKKKK
ncbi:V-type proton ATPase subunit F [Diplonema papillatum]|nr:V-type proton ATPase subunit F [Diplonema papillatum]